jgi:hypothetical protein
VQKSAAFEFKLLAGRFIQGKPSYAIGAAGSHAFATIVAAFMVAKFTTAFSAIVVACLETVEWG